MTMQLNTRLHLCAQNLQDQKLLAKLSAGDVVAQKLKYHGACQASSSECDACFSQMKHSSRCNDRSSVGAVELFLVNLNDNGISERLVSGG
jgi:hypothetical protein